MSQETIVVPNGTGQEVREGFNDALQTIASNFSGETAPAETFPGQLWFKTDEEVFYVRNAADDAWAELKTDTEYTVESRAPTVDDDETQGFEVGSPWIDDSGDTAEVYVCVSAAEGMAVWVHTSMGVDELGLLAIGNDASDVPLVEANIGRYNLSSEEDVQSAVEAFDKKSVFDKANVIPVGSMGPPDTDGLAKAQQLAAAGFISLDGDLISGGAWDSGNPAVFRGVTMTCAGDASGINFRFSYYSVLGALVTSGWISGANATTKTMLNAARGIVFIESDAPVPVAVSFGVGIPLVLLSPLFGKIYFINEGATAWWLLASGMRYLSDSTLLDSGHSGFCEVIVKKDATARTITFSQRDGLTSSEVLGAALEEGDDDSLIGYTCTMIGEVALWSNRGAQA